MKYDDETPPPAFQKNMTEVHAKLAGAASVRGLQHISDTAADALRKAVTQMEHVRVFASSRHKIHPTGLGLFDADLDYIKRSLVAIEKYRVERGDFVAVGTPSADEQTNTELRRVMLDAFPGPAFPSADCGGGK